MPRSLRGSPDRGCSIQFPNQECMGKLTDEAKPIDRQHSVGSAAALGAVAVLSLIAVGVARRPASIEGAGKGLLQMDAGLLLSRQGKQSILRRARSPHCIRHKQGPRANSRDMVVQ